MAGLAGFGVPFPAVPWANHLVVHDDALAEGAATVEADVVHGGESAVDVGDADNFLAQGEFAGFAGRGKVGFGGEFDEGHKKATSYGNNILAESTRIKHNRAKKPEVEALTMKQEGTQATGPSKGRCFAIH